MAVLKFRPKRRLSGALIRAAREAAGCSQELLAGHLGVSRTAVSDWETEKYPPGGQSLIDLADCLGVDVNGFFIALEVGDDAAHEGVGRKAAPVLQAAEGMEPYGARRGRRSHSRKR